jgi:signal transduction histidine kinase
VPDANWRHDLKNQLGVIVGYAELIQQGLDQSNPLRSEIEEIMKAAQHALMLVRQLESAD